MNKKTRNKKKEEKREDSYNYKLSDAEFWAILRENGGLYARTARAIQSRYGINYTRQAVKSKAESNPELLEDIKEEAVDLAEEVVVGIMLKGRNAEKLKAAELILKSKGGARGYAGKGVELLMQQTQANNSGNEGEAGSEQKANGGFQLVIKVAQD